LTHEAALEKDFIERLCQGEHQWTYRTDLKSEKALWDNLRNHINRINLAVLDGESLTDGEFQQLKVEFRRLTASPFEAAQWLRGENGIASIQIEREDIEHSKVSLVLFSNKDIAGGISSYEVVNQIKPDADEGLRGDVTLLINGLPIIHIELKAEYAKDGYMQAFDQIKRYAEAGFFDGIFATTQIFVVSNKVSTKYFARPSSNSAKAFEAARKFLFNWRTPENEPVENLYEFAREVLRIPGAHKLVSRFTILVDDKKSQKFLMVLRPYQIHAIKSIVRQASKHEGGFIWHATGSGKTITSFVATKLLAQTVVGVDRTVMVVDRTDLDNQTKGEFSKFASEFHTGMSSGNVTDNALIVGVDNRRQLTNSLLSNKNNNTIIVTTIQKLSAAIRDAKESEYNKFEKLKHEHIVFIVDECHRAVSDEEMKGIKKILPNSTWFGFTGTPIFEENQKQENGTFARTTQQQYGNLLHAYTTKNAMDDRAVLNFQVEYHCLLDDDSKTEFLYEKVKEKFPQADPLKQLDNMTELEKEGLLPIELFEQNTYIEKMLKKMFKRNSVMEQFKVQNGFPTMSAILTTHSIAQAKRIYYKLQELKNKNELLSGRALDERHALRDPDFPRVAITYSLSDTQDEMNAANEEMAGIMQAYNEQFGTSYTELGTFNRNVNDRLARKDTQYQKDGQWLDLVIVVDRLLTGFDAPTIQTLYVDRELKYQKLLQAFSRTNRTSPDKEAGMVVCFRKPHTMRQNVEDAIRLFSNEAQNWSELVPREYTKVKSEYMAAYESLLEAKQDLADDPNNLKKKIAQVRAFQALDKLQKAIKSYENYEEEFDTLKAIVKQLPTERGYAENLKAEIRAALADEDDGNAETLLQEIEFTSSGAATHKEKIDSFYINQLLGEYQKSSNKEDKEALRRKIMQEIDAKPATVQAIYRVILDSIDRQGMAGEWQKFFVDEIDITIRKAANALKVPETNLRTSFNEYSPGKESVPYINVILETSELDKDTFEAQFNEKFRKRSLVIEAYWKRVLDEELLPLREEIQL